MDAMVGLPGCRRILIVMVMQLVVLAAAATLSLHMTLSGLHTDLMDSAIVLLALPLGLLLLVFANLKVMSEPIELLWSINAKMRMQRIVFPALWAGLALFVLAFAIERVATFNTFWLASVEALAYAAPLGALAILSLNGIRRYIAMRRGAAEIERGAGGEKSGHERPGACQGIVRQRDGARIDQCPPRATGLQPRWSDLTPLSRAGKFRMDASFRAECRRNPC
jgi:hypothetical protein